MENINLKEMGQSEMASTNGGYMLMVHLTVAIISTYYEVKGAIETLKRMQ